jgi:hypothetical protein
VDEAKLIEKLRAIEALHSGATTAGERAAAAAARERIVARLAEFATTDPPVEYRFTIADAWARRVFNALLRRYGLKPYRYAGQHQQTVMVKVSKAFVDATLWPEFTALSAELRKHLDAITSRVVSAALGESDAEAEQIADPKRLGG